MATLIWNFPASGSFDHQPNSMLIVRRYSLTGLLGQRKRREHRSEREVLLSSTDPADAYLIIDDFNELTSAGRTEGTRIDHHATIALLPPSGKMSMTGQDKLRFRALFGCEAC